MNTYNNFITFLKGLEEGLEIEIDGYVYVVAYDSTNKPRITHKVETLNTKTGEKGFAYMQGMDLPEINNFIVYILNKISDEKATEINANIALNKIKKDEKT